MCLEWEYQVSTKEDLCVISFVSFFISWSAWSHDLPLMYVSITWIVSCEPNLISQVWSIFNRERETTSVGQRRATSHSVTLRTGRHNNSYSSHSKYFVEISPGSPLPPPYICSFSLLRPMSDCFCFCSGDLDRQNKITQEILAKYLQRRLFSHLLNTRAQSVPVGHSRQQRARAHTRADFYQDDALETVESERIPNFQLLEDDLQGNTVFIIFRTCDVTRLAATELTNFLSKNSKKFYMKKQVS